MIGDEYLGLNPGAHRQLFISPFAAIDGGIAQQH
jgi:hypothetical protein